MKAIPDDATIPPVAKRAMEILANQCDELEDRNRDLAGAVTVLATAIRDIEAIAADEMDLDRHDLSSILHICQTGGVRAALEAS